MRSPLRGLLLALAPCVLVACASVPGGSSHPVSEPASASAQVLDVGPFSGKAAGASLPAHWETFVVPFKSRTAYRLVATSEGVVLEAEADGSASGLRRSVSIDPRSHRYIDWRWRVMRALPKANKRDAAREDSPARLVVAFDGDRAKIDPAERAMMNLVEALSGQAVPYATLMYVYANHEPPGTILPNPRTSRVKMVVVEQGGEGRWSSFRRNVAEDYRQAFGEEPGRITAIGVMTDADNTQDSARAQYGNIRFLTTR